MTGALSGDAHLWREALHIWKWNYEKTKEMFKDLTDSDNNSERKHGR
jgi:hypothetical protein